MEFHNCFISDRFVGFQRGKAGSAVGLRSPVRDRQQNCWFLRAGEWYVVWVGSCTAWGAELFPLPKHSFADRCAPNCHLGTRRKLAHLSRTYGFQGRKTALLQPLSRLERALAWLYDPLSNFIEGLRRSTPFFRPCQPTCHSQVQTYFFDSLVRRSIHCPFG